MLVVVARTLELRPPSRGGARRSRRINSRTASAPGIFCAAFVRTLKRAEARAPWPAANALTARRLTLAAVLAFLIFNFALPASAATTINAANHYAYAANLGWVDARGDVTSGAVIGEFVCSGSGTTDPFANLKY